MITEAQFLEHYPQLSGAGLNTLLAKLIARADQLMAAWCCHPLTDTNIHTLEAATYTLYPTPRHDQPRVFELPHPLATAVTTLHVDEDWAYGASTLIAAADYHLDTRTRELWRRPTATGLPWSRSPRANKLVLVAGIVSGSATPEFVAMAAFAARHLLDLGPAAGQAAMSQASQSITHQDVDKLLPASVKEQLGVWRNWGGLVG